MRRAILLAAAVLSGLNACAPAITAKTTATAATPAGILNGDPTNGRRVYAARCSACHGATGIEGGSIGPSLRHENARMDFAATVSWISDPKPPMPHLYPETLSLQEVRDVAQYVQSL